MAEEVGSPKAGRFVGIFYFLWHNEPSVKSPHWNGPYDIQKILAADPEALNKPASPLWGNIGVMHYWGEPIYGYYRSDDPWVLRRHAHLLADAGVDTLIFDTTNARTYPDVYLRLCEVFSRIRSEGGRTPGIVFMVNTQAGATAQKIYDELYKPGLYKDLWFIWQGRPLMICDPAEASSDLKNFFSLRRAHWPFTLTNTPHAWHWEATYPQPYGYTDDPQKPEQVNVSVAQNLREKDGKVTNMSEGNARGRSFHQGRMDRSPGAVKHGHNFQEQWRRVFDLDPPFAMVTGWNEWIAGRWGKPGGPLVFVDQFDQEYSRDIEPMQGGHLDNYYWQLVANVRRYKGVPPLQPASAPVRLAENGWPDWAEVRPEYRDHTGETDPRAFQGVGGLSYTNNTGRNDLVSTKVARDATHVYFCARTKADLSPSTDSAWMWLLIDADQNADTGWHGYDFVVNRGAANGSSTIEKWDADKGWKKNGEAQFTATGSELQLRVRRSALGLSSQGTKVNLDFKWADNLPANADPMAFYVFGDVAPEGRFNFRYRAE